MVQRVSIPLDIDGFLPLAETSQGVVRMVGNFQILLQEGTPGPPQLADICVTHYFPLWHINKTVLSSPFVLCSHTKDL